VWLASRWPRDWRWRDALPGFTIPPGRVAGPLEIKQGDGVVARTGRIERRAVGDDRQAVGQAAVGEIGAGLGNVIIKLEGGFHKDLAFNFTPDNPDHHILNVAYTTAKENPSKTVVIVSKDVNLRMKAKAIDLLAEDYASDQVSDIDDLYKGWREIENAPDEAINALYKDPGEINIDLIYVRAGLK